MAKTNDATASTYDASDIQVLKGLEAVRKRPGMYIGSTSSRGLHHLVYEVVDNSIDEALAGYCDTVRVVIHPDNSITVEDNGRGIPVDIHPIEKIPGVELAMTVLHAGGKFDKSSYKVSGGLHGVGVSVVNALSETLKVWVKRDGQEHFMEFRRGDTVRKLEVIGKVGPNESGTKVWFKPDPEIFTELVYDYAILQSRLRELSYLNKGVHDHAHRRARGPGAGRDVPRQGRAARNSSRTSTRASRACTPRSSISTSRRTTSASSSRCSTTTATTRTSSPSSTTSTRTRAARTSRASSRRSRARSTPTPPRATR